MIGGFLESPWWLFGGFLGGGGTYESLFCSQMNAVWVMVTIGRGGGTKTLPKTA